MRSSHHSAEDCVPEITTSLAFCVLTCKTRALGWLIPQALQM